MEINPNNSLRDRRNTNMRPERGCRRYHVMHDLGFHPPGEGDRKAGKGEVILTRRRTHGGGIAKSRSGAVKVGARIKSDTTWTSCLDARVGRKLNERTASVYAEQNTSCDFEPARRKDRVG